MKTYTVVWEIDVEAETPKEAVEQAFRHMQETGTTATCFSVKPMNSKENPVMVDLQLENAA